MKVTEGIKILAIMTVLLGLWYLYGSFLLLKEMLTEADSIAEFDQLYINTGKIYYRIMAYVYPIATIVLIIGSIGVLRGYKLAAITIVIISSLFLINEIITQTMGNEWLSQAFISPHFTPILYVFNIIFFSMKLWKNNHKGK